jgi:hypothetical protein
VTDLRPDDRRRELGERCEGWAFTFCKAAFLALLLQRFTLLVTAAAATLLYVVAARYGVSEWRCWVKPPWVVVFFGVVAVVEAFRLFLGRG